MDLTTILAAAIAGLSGVAAGYLGMRQQTRTMRDQLRAERDRDLSKRKETLQDGRAQSYGNLLNVERGLRLLLASGRSFSYAEYAKWWHDYGELTSLIVITGTAAVSSQAVTLEGLYGQVDADRMSVASERLTRTLTLAFQRHEPEIERARAYLIELMRADVAPDDGSRMEGGPRRAYATDELGAAMFGPDHREIAVISTAKTISRDRLRQVVAAVQEQLNRDFGPVWHVSASLAVYDDTSQIAAGVWRINVEDDIGEPGMASFHTYEDRTPYTMVAAMEGWELHFSHDCLEMLANPFNENVKEGPSPKKGRGRVSFSVQVCDPCPTFEEAYEINGVTVSDFILPDFYDLSQPVGKRYDHKGVIAQPFEIAPGGYLTWYDEGHLWQSRLIGDRPEYIDLGKYAGLGAAIEALKSPRIGFFGSPPAMISRD